MRRARLLLLFVSVWITCVGVVNAGTYRENFDEHPDGWTLYKGNAGSWFVDETAEWDTDDGVLIARSNNVCQSASTFAFGDESWVQYEFRVDFLIEETHFLAGCKFRTSQIGFGVHFSNPPGLVNGVVLNVETDDGAAWNVASAEWFHNRNEGLLDVLNIVTVDPGAWHRLRLTTDGNRYEGWIDDELVLDTVQTTPGVGGVALRIRNVEARFDNLRISGEAIPDAGLSAAPRGKLPISWGFVKTSF